MIITAQPNRTDEVEITIAMRATLKEWIELKEQLKDSYPSWQLSSAITDCIIKMETQYSEEIKID